MRNLALKKYHRNTAKKRNSTYDVALEEIAEYLPSGSNAEDELQAKELATCINDFLDTLDRQDLRKHLIQEGYLYE